MKRYFVCAVLCVLLCVFGASPCCAAVSDRDVWDGVSVTEPTKITTIDGEDYYQIHTCAELAYLIQTENYLWEAENISLEADLVINDTELLFDEDGNCLNGDGLYPWTPMNRFKGIFLGNDHTISGVYISGNDYGVGFFQDLRGSVYDLHIKNSYVENQSYYTGGVCGTLEVYSNYYSDYESGESGYRGDVSRIQNCSFDGVVRGTGGTGAIVGRVWVNGEGDYTDPSAFPVAVISDCVARGSVFSTSGYSTGGIAGVLDGKWATIEVDDCLNLAAVNGYSEVGGVVGEILLVADLDVRVDSCVNRGNVFATSASVGGIVGSCKGVGNTLLQYCVNEGSVESEAYYVGGIAGALSTRDNYGNNDYYQDKNVAPGRQEVRYCVSRGTVSAVSESSGGLLGMVTVRDEGTILIHDSYFAGEISAGTVAGSMVGCMGMYPDSSYSMECCYAVGQLSGARAGGLVGSIRYYDGCTVAPRFENCKWLKTMTAKVVGDNNVSPMPDAVNCSALSSDQLKQQKSFSGFDFEAVWCFDTSDGYLYPKLMERPVNGKFGEALSWEWFASSCVLKLTPEILGAERYAAIAQYADGCCVRICFFDLTDGMQALVLNDPNTVETKLFLLTEQYAPLA